MIELDKQTLGKWVDHDRHGKGCQLFADGTFYEGQWRNGMMNDDNGIMTWPDGDKYVGGYVDDKQQGKGKQSKGIV